MHPVRSLHERPPHILPLRSLTPTTVAATDPTAASSAPAPSAASPPTAVVAAASTSATLAACGTSSLDHHISVVEALPSTATAAQSVSSYEHVMMGSKSPNPHSLSVSASLPAPPTPSSWMVRGPSSGGSPTMLLAMDVGVYHDSCVSASSVNSSAGNPIISPLLRPHSHNNSYSTSSNPAAHDSAGETEGADGFIIPMERASGRKRTPRSAALSVAASGGSAAAAADADSLTAPAPVRLVFSRRTSTGGSIGEGSDDFCARGCHPCSSLLAEDDALLCSQTRLAVEASGDEDAEHAHADGHKVEVQSTLHSSRHRGSGVATTMMRTPSPIPANLPSVPLGVCVKGGVMSDVLTTAPTASTVTRLSSHSLKAPVSGVAAAEPHSSHFNAVKTSAVDMPPAAAASSSRGTHSPPPSCPPACFATPADHTHHTTVSPLPRFASSALKQLEKPSHSSGPLCSDATGSIHDALNSNIGASHRVAGAAELPNWRRYSNTAICCPMLELYSEPDSRMETEGADGAAAASISEEQDSSAHAGPRHINSHENSAAVVLLAHHAAASVTTVTSTLVPFLHTAAASATTSPYDKREVPSLSTLDAPHPSKTREAPPSADTQSASPHALTPFTDAWTAHTSTPMSREQSSGSRHCQQQNQLHRTHGVSSSSSSHGCVTPESPAAAGVSTGVCAPSDMPAPVFSNTETQPSIHATAQAHKRSSFVNCHANFSRALWSPSVASGTAAADTMAGKVGEGSAPLLKEINSDRSSGAPSIPPLPPPLPPPSRTPITVKRSAGSVIFVCATTPTNQRATSTFSAGSSTAHPSDCVAPASRTQQGTTSPAPPPPRLLLTESHDTKQQQPPLQRAQRMRSFSNCGSSPALSSERLSFSCHGVDKDSNTLGAAANETNAPAVQTTMSALPIHSHHNTPEQVRVEAIIDGMPIVVLPPPALLPQSVGDGDPISAAATSTAAGHAHALSHHHRQHSHIRCSSFSSSSGVQSRPHSKGRHPDVPTALSTEQSREFLYSSDSSWCASTPQTLTSTMSDAMLSFSSANLAAPMVSNGCNLTNALNVYAVNASSNGGGGAPTAQATSAGAEGFVMKPDAETIQSLPRSKTPRMPGCSMRDWAAHLAEKEAENRRQQQGLGSGFPRSGQHHQRVGSSPINGPSTSISGGTASAASSPASQHTAGPRAALPRMTPQEVAKHNTPDDLWMVIRNVVYDCTAFQRFHPGGERVLLACAGRDATMVYDRFHAWVSCESFLGPYAVGVLAPPPHQ
ncbi:hypothetical protein ABL78_6002 [Leptomonas seymouri]|uniref:Cytochrome b5 heme-binding domain-containing protein n=1 Tax=Leptomonas seymouri TaxID=5684 RepID=A0A0N1PC84_LEPSE|nr:hypothetical protein ABL78_6002 [Leptomonas seymouri]|eukprot:KPI84935.1 hypothetical protein ABL78_6002 [Leptomonas seymouri]